MEAYVQFLLLGLGAGAIYAGLATGVVLAYQGAGVISFAHGAIAMYVAYVFDELRKTGDYVLPLVGLPDRIHLGDDLGLWLPLALALATAAALGLLMHALVFARLRGQPLLARVVASVGVMIVLQALVVLRFGTSNRIVAAVLPTGSATVPGLGVRVPVDRLWLTAVVVVVTAALWAASRFTRFGLATRAAAVEVKGAILLGYSPGRLAAGNWVVAAMAAGLVGILGAPLSGLNAVNYVLFVVPALAAALAGRLTSLPIAAAAGLGLGMFESVIAKVATWDAYPSWLPFAAAQKALPFLVIVIVLFATGRTLPGRGSVDEIRQPRSPFPRLVVPTSALLAGAGVLAVLLLPSALRFHLYVSLAAAIVLLSITILTGFVGQVSLAQAVFAGAAGFTTAKLAAASVPFPVAPILGALIATGVGLLLAVPALRIRGAQLAVVTMAAGIAVEELIFRNPSVTGAAGAVLVEPPTLLGLDLAANRANDFNRIPFGLLLVAVVTLVALLTANLRRSGTGRRMLALRANEQAAAAAGIDTVRTKLLAFALSSFVAGLGGAMLAYLRGGISSESFNVFISLTYLAFAYLGGIASVFGALLGAALVPSGAVFGLVGETLGAGEVGRYAQLIGGIALIVQATLLPEGLASGLRRAATWSLRRRAVAP